MSHIHPISVREARAEDIPGIVALHDACHAGHPRDGFFIDRGDAAELAQYVGDSTKRCLVAEDAGGLLGFVQANREIERLDEVVWSASALREPCVGAGHWHVDNVAVQPFAKGRGVASRLYAELTRRARAVSLSAYIVAAPMMNEASLAFHRRAGFEPAGEFRLEEFCGVREYRSMLLVHPGLAAGLAPRGAEVSAASVPVCIESLPVSV